MAELPPLASVAKLAVRLGYGEAGFPTQAETDRAQQLLIEASELIRDEAEKDWVTGDPPQLSGVPARVESICLAAAARAFDNPDGLTQRSIGDSNKSWDRAGREGGEVVYLTDREKRSIRKAAGGSTFTAVTVVSPYSGDGIESLLGS